jgi:hypothetical protein
MGRAAGIWLYVCLAPALVMRILLEIVPAFSTSNCLLTNRGPEFATRTSGISLFNQAIFTVLGSQTSWSHTACRRVRLHGRARVCDSQPLGLVVSGVVRRI